LKGIADDVYGEAIACSVISPAIHMKIDFITLHIEGINFLHRANTKDVRKEQDSQT
jgi:hypothetical protein